MKFIATCFLLAGLFGGVGCNNMEKVPEQTQAKRTKTSKPLEEENVPAAVSKLLPAEQLDAANAQAQIKAFEQQLAREKGQLERTESANRD